MLTWKRGQSLGGNCHSHRPRSDQQDYHLEDHHDDQDYDLQDLHQDDHCDYEVGGDSDIAYSMIA